MTWVVDTCVLIDIAMRDPQFAELSYNALESRPDDALVISPISYIELSPCFHGSVKDQNAFLNSLYIDCRFFENDASVVAAHQAWYQHVQRKRAGIEKKRPIADVLIGAYAKSRGGLITRNEADFKTLYPDLTICNPATERMI